MSSPDISKVRVRNKIKDQTKEPQVGKKNHWVELFYEICTSQARTISVQTKTFLILRFPK